MYRIVSVGDIVAEINAKNGKENAQRAYEIFKEIYMERGLFQTQEEILAAKNSFRAINDISAKILTGRYVLPLSAGSGKSTFMVAWCAFIHRFNVDYSVAIASLQVEACFKLRQQLLDLGIPEEDIGVLYSDKGKKMEKFKSICPSTSTPSRHRFLLVTHARLEEKNHRNSCLDFRGKERSIIFYDEEFRPRKGFHFDIQSLRQDIAGFVTVADDLNLKDISANDLSLVKKLLQSVLSNLETHLSCKAQSKVIIFHTKHWTDAERKSALRVARLLNKKSKLNKNTTDFVEYALGKSHMFLKDSKLYGYFISIPDEIQQMLILDASYKLSKLSQLDEELEMLPIDISRMYSGQPPI